jgi:hypothetical protein
MDAPSPLGLMRPVIPRVFPSILRYQGGRRGSGKKQLVKPRASRRRKYVRYFPRKFDKTR